MNNSWLMIALLLTAINVAADNNPQLKSGVFEPPRRAPDFSLPSSHGTTFTLSEHHGQLIILGFGFSYCPEICPTTLSNLAKVRKKLGAAADQIAVVYITVDPERDTVERLREYMGHFHSSFIGITGSPEQLAKLRAAYGVLAAKEVYDDGHYDVHHSSYIYLIDRQGQLRALVPYGKTADDIVHDINILLQEKPARAAS